ncbi:caspase activity and apoptosis inhibitor 1 [Tachysurus vachellii]|uniref:caspase activity and apoptosis inhibitor 1 n=1 Tax=Tachysurus vachellii TaxID=175792 RepID=UPI00296A916A|nr:caspase activity and apoptosis inhibitor 1 [Tachysurus vachellii]
MKSAKEKKRKHSRRESADGDRKKRNTESSMVEPKEEQHHVQELKEEPSDIEEGGLDLTVPFKPISDYLSNRQEMLEQCFHVLGQNKLKKMLPDELKGCTFMEIKTLCWDQLEQLSENNLLQILEGKEVTASSEAEEKETNRTSADSQQDNSVDSTSSMKENAEEDKQGLSGEESDVLSINADMNDSDIEGHKDPKPQEQIPVPMVMPPLSSAPPPEADLKSDEPKLELQDDIDKSVSEILALTDHSSDEAQIKLRSQEVAMEAAPASFPVPAAAPSAQQLALLELEMRARAIKALMKANEVKK